MWLINTTNASSADPSAKEMAKSDLELAKLKLEIESLKKKNRWEIIAQFLPLIATTLAVAGFFLTILQFESRRTAERTQAVVEQQKERLTREIDQTTRLQNQIRTDIDEILRFTRDEQQTVARVSFLLEDMKTVMESKVNEKDKVSDIFPQYERRLTKSLVIMVRDDCDFSKNPRDVGLANIVIDRWDDYSIYLKGEPQKLDYILYEYIRALESLRDQNPGYLEGMQLDDGFKPSREYAKEKTEPILYNHFIDILDGFREHIALLGTDNLSEEAGKLKKKHLDKLQSALRNQTISNYIICTYFPEQPCLKEESHGDKKGRRN